MHASYHGQVLIQYDFRMADDLGGVVDRLRFRITIQVSPFFYNFLVCFVDDCNLYVKNLMFLSPVARL